MRIAILSDTHAPRFWKRVPDAVARQLGGSELILHAGDVCIPEVLQDLSAFAPVRAVRGNNDGDDVAAWGADDTWVGEIAGVRTAMVHDSGPAAGRAMRLQRRFRDAQLVVFGHSHIPWHRTIDGQTAFNPGSPTDKRRQPYGTMGLADLIDGRIVSLELVEVS